MNKKIDIFDLFCLIDDNGIDKGILLHLLYDTVTDEPIMDEPIINKSIAVYYQLNNCLIGTIVYVKNNPIKKISNNSWSINEWKEFQGLSILKPIKFVNSNELKNYLKNIYGE